MLLTNIKIKGLDYLHDSSLGYHCNLSTMNCVIDSNFIVKIVPIDIEDLLEEWKRLGNIIEYSEKLENQEQNKSEENSTDSNNCKLFF